MRKTKRKMPEYNWIQFQSPEEVEVYKAILEGYLWDLIWDKSYNKAIIVNPRCNSFSLYEAFKAWDKSFRQIIYTPDFEIKLWNKNIIVEVKSKWTAMKSDYRLRLKVFLYLYRKEINFIEIIKEKKWIWNLIKYF